MAPTGHLCLKSQDLAISCFFLDQTATGANLKKLRRALGSNQHLLQGRKIEGLVAFAFAKDTAGALKVAWPGYALPAAQQATRVRSRRPTADVDTCAAAFWLWKDRADEHLDALAQYDLVVVDEVSQLDAEQFERIIQMWEAANQRPVFTGDFWQLPGVGNSQATDSPKWRMTFKVDLHEMWRCKDEKLRKKLQLLRAARPTADQLEGYLPRPQGLDSRGRSQPGGNCGRRRPRHLLPGKAGVHKHHPQAARGRTGSGGVALSQVQRDADYLLGSLLNPEHFTPAH